MNMVNLQAGQCRLVNGSNHIWVCTDGTAWNSRLNRNAICSTRSRGGQGYIRTTLGDVHRLMAKTFLRELKKGEQVNHIDGNKLNNQLYNLEIVTAKQNQQHALKNGLRENTIGENSKEAKLSNKTALEVAYLLRDSLYNRHQIAKMYDVTVTTIRFLDNGRTWKRLTTEAGFTDYPISGVRLKRV